MTISLITISSTTVTPTTAYLGDTVTLTAEMSETIPISHLAMWIIDFDETTDSSTTIFELINQGRVITNEWSAFAQKTSMSSEVQIDESMLEAHTLTFILAQGGSTEISISDSSELFTIGDPINVSFKLHLYDKVKKLGNQWFYLKDEISTLLNAKEDNVNKVTSLSSSSTNTQYPSAKAVYDSLPSVPSASSTVPSADTTTGSVGTGTGWARSDHTHPKSSLYAESIHAHSIEDTDLFDVLDCINTNFDNFLLWDIVFNTNNYNGHQNKRCSVTNNGLRNNAVSSISLNKEFTSSTNYTLEFDYYTSVSNRNGFYFGTDPSLTDGTDMYTDDGGLHIVVNIGNTLVETYTGGSSATTLYTHTSNLLTSGTHHIKIIRDGANATFYIDDVELYTYTNAQYNTIGLDKWSSGYNTISNIEITIGD